jgi:hypothetical protein
MHCVPIVADGWDRARRASQVVFRAEVTEEYAARLEATSAAERERLLVEVDREVKRRVAAKAPLWGLY